MEKLREEEIQQICDLYKTHKSLRKVSKISSRSLGIVHKYISSHSLIQKQNIVQKICTNDERLIGVYVGLWLGDGTQYKDRNQYTIKICSNKEDVNLNKFIQELLLKIFNKNSALIEELDTKRAYIKFSSKFIFDFIRGYILCDSGKKTYTVKLKKRANCYSGEFREGCLLGLALSDGYLKERFIFSIASSRLAKNMYDILKGFRFNPHCTIQKREKYKWNNLYSVYLNKRETNKLRLFLNKIINDLGFRYSFQELKYGPGRI